MKLSWKLLALFGGLCVFSSVMAQDAYQLSAWQKFKAALKIGTHGMGAEEYAEYERRKEAMKATMTAEQYAQQKGALKEGLIQQTHGWYSEIKQQREVEKAKVKQEKEAAKVKEKQEKEAAKAAEKVKEKEEKVREKESSRLEKQIKDLQKREKTGQLTNKDREELLRLKQSQSSLREASIQANPEKYAKMREELNGKQKMLEGQIANLQKGNASSVGIQQLQRQRDAIASEIEKTLPMQERIERIKQEAEKIKQEDDARINQKLRAIESDYTKKGKAFNFEVQKKRLEESMQTSSDYMQEKLGEIKQEYGLKELPAVTRPSLEDIGHRPAKEYVTLPAQPPVSTQPTGAEKQQQMIQRSEALRTGGEGYAVLPTKGEIDKQKQAQQKEMSPAKEYVTLPAQPSVSTQPTGAEKQQQMIQRSEALRTGGEGYAVLPTKKEIEKQKQVQQEEMYPTPSWGKAMTPADVQKMREYEKQQKQEAEQYGVAYGVDKGGRITKENEAAMRKYVEEQQAAARRSEAQQQQQQQSKTTVPYFGRQSNPEQYGSIDVDAQLKDILKQKK